jgi:hypothetical protein
MARSRWRRKYVAIPGTAGAPPANLTVSDGQRSLAVSGAVASLIWWLLQKRSFIEAQESLQVTFHVRRGRRARAEMRQEEEIP